jgi:hypothetical protein
MLMAHALNISGALLTRQAPIISLPGLGLPLPLPGLVVEIGGDVESIGVVVVRVVAGARVDSGMVVGARVAGSVEEVSPELDQMLQYRTPEYSTTTPERSLNSHLSPEPFPVL